VAIGTTSLSIVLVGVSLEQINGDADADITAAQPGSR
jgi:hypothetical protein